MTRADAPDVSADQAFREVIGRFASGVTVITTAVDGQDFGTTASAVSSLSADPPMLLICLNTTSDTRAAVLRSGVFGVNILAEDQGDIAYQFAKKGPAKFENVAVTAGASGVPLVDGALAHLECDVEQTVAGGTHTVFLARVRTAQGHQGAPLTYFRGRFGRLESALDEAAYQELRARVVERRLAQGEPLDLTQLARELGVDAQRLFYAVTKLCADGLLTRAADSYVVTPMTVPAATQLFEARAVVELGVAEQTVGSASADRLDELARLADELAVIVDQPAPDLSAFLRASHDFHRRLVALAGSQVLTDAYDRLGIVSFWNRTMADRAWWREFDVVHHSELVDAYRQADLERVKQLIRQHRDQVTGMVEKLIVEAGGAI